MADLHFELVTPEKLVMAFRPVAYRWTSAIARLSGTGMPFLSVQVSGLWQNWHRNMQAVVQPTSRIPGPSTADPVVKEWRKPKSPVLSAVFTSVSGTFAPR